jgi:small subunit ribosomal protein S1
MADMREIREARVVRVGAGVVVLDIGSKYESVVPLSEWPGGQAPSVGDKLYVLIHDSGSSEDQPREVEPLVVRRVPLPSAQKVFAELIPGQTREGCITRRIAGGFLVDIGVNAFLHDEDLTDAMRRDPDACVGQALTWRILEVDAVARTIRVVQG